MPNGTSSGMPMPTETSLVIPFEVIIGISIFVVVVLIVVQVFFWRRYRSALSEIRNLTKEEVDEFYFGNKKSGQNEENVPVDSLPFVQRQIILSEDLIADDFILGEGEIQERLCSAVIELSPFGDLHNYLRTNYVNTSGELLQPPLYLISNTHPEVQSIHDILICFCRQIAEGMEFLSMKRKITAKTNRKKCPVAEDDSLEELKEVVSSTGHRIAIFDELNKKRKCTEV
ncbi:unnamed protein product [Allacma fusca]|uniref:Uncharacterized protein n=1 Tax=Allacma fusca TaxID=39272 RepID=A0A8J2KNT7_9HEXA|nr:unnamed protein product [Allacma fusca]